jgi:DNA-binding transcriptional regulator LsrR (DeoR family)
MAEAGREQMAAAARLYYLDGLGQHEVAGILGVSRSTVSRLLTAARERGIVRISVDSYEPRDAEAERRLRDRFGLRRAVVVKSGGRPTESVRRAIGHDAAPALAAAARGASTIGVSGGRTIGEAIGAVAPVAGGAARETTVVQLMGHVDPTARRIDAPELGRTLAERLGGSFATLPAPVFAPDRATRDAFLAHPQVRSVWRRFQALDLAFVGVGTLEESVFIERGVLTPDDYAALRALGAVGEICGRFFDADGREVASDHRDRVVGVELDRLRAAPEVVAITHGASRASAILAALRGGLVSSLVIDDDGAAALLGRGADVDAPRLRRKGGPDAGPGEHGERAAPIPGEVAGIR